MNSTDKQWLSEIESHLQLAAGSRKVLYLEDRTDARTFFALLGIAEPPGQPLLHQGVLVQGLGEQTLGRGKKSVQRRIQLTQGRRGFEGIAGMVDGDGASLPELSANFDAPYPGRLYKWKAYAIENLLAKVGWPPAWGPQPQWSQVLLQYAPYAAFNLLVAELQKRLIELGFGGFVSPSPGAALIDSGEITAELEAQRPQFLQDNFAGRFMTHLREVERRVRESLDEGHTAINGKWLVDDYAPRQTGLRAEDCWNAWVEHVRAQGGLPEVRQFWKRWTGNPP